MLHVWAASIQRVLLVVFLALEQAQEAQEHLRYGRIADKVDQPAVHLFQKLLLVEGQKSQPVRLPNSSSDSGVARAVLFKKKQLWTVISA